MALTQISTAGVKDDAVTAGKIPANAVGSSELADNAVDTAAIADDAVTSAKIADATIVNANINASAAIAGTKIAPDFGTQQISSGNITVSSNAPNISFVDGNDNPDYKISANSGALNFEDTTNSANRLIIQSDGTVDVQGNLDANSGLDVTGAITGTGDLTIDTTTLKVDSSNNRVGIGIANPAVKLDVTGKIHAATSIGIRTTSPQNNLHVHQDDSSSVVAQFTNSTTTIGSDRGFHLGLDSSEQGFFNLRENKPLLFEINGSERMRLDSSGNLGLGITSTTENTTGDSGQKFITAGDIQIDGDQKALVFRSTGSTAQLQSGIQWWNENGAGVQAKIHCDRTHTTLAKSDLVFYTSANVDTSANNSQGDITEQMRISSAGYVTKPNHPAFRAGRQTTDQNVGSGSTIIFNQASSSYKHFNTGSHYNTSNGRFTAPVAGVYHFYALIIWEGMSDNTNMSDSFDIYVNNSQAAFSSRRAHYRNEYTGQGAYFTDHATVTIKLAANDYVWCRNKYNNKVVHNNDTYTTFQGHLVG